MTTMTLNGNGKLKPATRDDVRQMKRDNAYMREQIKHRGLQRANKLLESFNNYDWVTVYSDMLDRFRNPEIGGGSIANANDRHLGKSYPMFQNEQDLARLRMPSRILCATNNYAIGLLGGLTSYVIGTGYDYRATPRKGVEKRCPQELADACQLILDDFGTINRWKGGEQPAIEDECFWRSCEDGEFLLRLFPQDDGRTFVRTLEPEQLTAKPIGNYAEWSFGIHTPENDAQDVRGYYVFYGTDPTKGEEVCPDEIVHLRRNVKRSIKRGMPDFTFDTYDALAAASKLRRACGIGAAIQASIAWVRQHETASADEVNEMVTTLSDWSATNPTTGKTEKNQKIEPGSIVDVDKGTTYVAPPSAGANGTAHLAILEMLAVAGGIRWNAPPWLSSGQNSSANYATALTEESPFVRTIQRAQTGYKAAFVRPYWFALEHYIKTKGRIVVGIKTDGGVVQKAFTWDEVKQLIDIQVEAHSPEVRNKMEEAQANAIRVQGGWKSPQTVQAEEGLDSAREEANIAEWKEKMGGQGAGLQLPEAGGGSPFGGGGNPQRPTQESRRLRESFDESKVKRDAGKFAKTAGSGAADGDHSVKDIASMDGAKLLKAGYGAIGAAIGSLSKASPEEVKAALADAFGDETAERMMKMGKSKKGALDLAKDRLETRLAKLERGEVIAAGAKAASGETVDDEDVITATAVDDDDEVLQAIPVDDEPEEKPAANDPSARLDSEEKRDALKEKLGDKYWGNPKEGQPYYRPGANPTVDNVITRDGKDGKEVLLIQRKKGTVEGEKWALPGGFHDTDAKKGEAWKEGHESAEDAAMRELAEETGLDAKELQAHMKHVGEYEGGGRDPRNNDEAWSKSNAFSLHLPPELASKAVAGQDDAQDAKWVPMSKVRSLDMAFDHGKILNDAHNRADDGDGKDHSIKDLHTMDGKSLLRAGHGGIEKAIKSLNSASPDELKHAMADAFGEESAGRMMKMGKSRKGVIRLAHEKLSNRLAALERGEVIAAAAKDASESLRESSFDESKVKRDGGKFAKTAGSHAKDAHAKNQDQQKKKSDDQPAEAQTPDTSTLNKIADTGKKVLAGALDLEHGAKEFVKDKFDTLPNAVKAPVAGFLKVFYGTYVVAQDAVDKVATAQGMDEKGRHRLASVVCAIDAVGMKANAVIGGALAGPAAATAASFVPIGSVGYLAFTAMSNPAIVIDGCKSAVKNYFSRKKADDGAK